MAEWAALGTVATWIGGALTAYGKYQEFFGPAEHVVDWNVFIVASEKRIITAIKQQEFKQYTRRISVLCDWWTGTCVEFLKDHPISPENIDAFNARVDIHSLHERINSLNDAIKYFREDAPGDYGTYGALATSYTLLYIFLTVDEMYYVAVNSSKSGSTQISRAIIAGIQAINAWPARYYTERASHMKVEIEQKYKGGGGILGSPGVKRPTGWYILHDTATDPAVPSFEGQRFFHKFPNAVTEVTQAYPKSTLAITELPALLVKWGDLYNKARQTEKEPLTLALVPKIVELPRPPPPDSDVFESTRWYRFKNFSPPFLAIDVINDPSTIESDAQLHLVKEQDVSGQYWQIRRSPTSHGSFNLCTLFLGTKMSLDVYGDDNTRPHLAPTADVPGQQWQLSSAGDGTWRLTNSFSGPDLWLDVKVQDDGSATLLLRDKQETSVTQKWLPWGLRLITEDGFS
ncbi:MAG: hypothetical protein M4579_000455 [Chaenotheca gracillima]|nr:MAG: hypothetical protein M4579_000455 [Chaenotheca gracillima]